MVSPTLRPVDTANEYETALSADVTGFETKSTLLCRDTRQNFSILDLTQFLPMVTSQDFPHPLDDKEDDTRSQVGTAVRRLQDAKHDGSSDMQDPLTFD